MVVGSVDFWDDVFLRSNGVLKTDRRNKPTRMTTTNGSQAQYDVSTAVHYLGTSVPVGSYPVVR